MKHYKIIFLPIALLLVMSSFHEILTADCSKDCTTSDIVNDSVCTNQCYSVYIPRPTYNNTAYFWFPWRKDVNCEVNGVAELGFEYQRSFNNDHISRALFGGNTIHFQGSSITGASRDPRALIADNFGLSTVCDTVVAFKPRIQNYNLNFQGRLGLDTWVEGLYGELYFAFTHQNRSLHLTNACATGQSCEVVCNASPACSFSDCSINSSCDMSPESYTSPLNTCMSCPLTTGTVCTTPFAAGYMAAGVAPTVANLSAALTGATFGNMTTPWAFGQFPLCSQTKNAVSGVAVVAGWNFLQNDCGHLGLFFQYVAPTGNKPDPRLLFSPVVGNGKHHEVGGGLSAHYEVWSNDCGQELNIYLDGYVMTALRNCQIRSFDFLGKGCLSRYMLLEGLNPVTPATYAGFLINGINFATRKADVKISVKGDATLRFVYSHGGFNVGLGYNVYGQAQESICLKNEAIACNGVDILNPQFVYGFKGCASPYVNGTAVTPAITQSNATIKSCGTNDATPVVIQNPVGISVTSCNATCSPVSNNCSTGCSDKSNAALFNGVFDVDSGAAPKQFTNKGIVTLDYTWEECNCAPYLGIGGEVEGGSKYSLNQWGIWLKGGIQF